MKQHKVSTTGQRKQAIATVLRAVTRGNKVTDGGICKKYGVSNLCTRLVKHGFLIKTDEQGIWKPLPELTTWKPEEILDLIFLLKNGKESKVLKRLEGAEPPATQETLFSLEKSKDGVNFEPVAPLFTPTDLLGDMAAASGAAYYGPYQHIIFTENARVIYNRIQESLVLIDKYSIENKAGFILDYLLEKRK